MIAGKSMSNQKEVLDADGHAESDLSLREWILKNLGTEPDAMSDDEDSMTPVRWVPGVGFVKVEKDAGR